MPIYLDNNATTPLDANVFEAMRPYLGGFAGNPSSKHAAGRVARRGIDKAAEQIAEALNCDIKEIVFTSGATEANNLAIFGQAGPHGSVLAVSTVEHPSCSEPASVLAKRGWRIRELPVDATGSVAPETDWLDAQTKLLIVQWANGETGRIQAVDKIAAALSKNCRWHCDAVQAIGKTPVDFRASGATTMSISGHKIHGPQGVGALIIRDGKQLQPTTFGGHQQNGLRPGTEPVAAIAGLGAAVAMAVRDLDSHTAAMRAARNAFEAKLLDSNLQLVINVDDNVLRLPNTSNISFLRTNAETVLIALDLEGIQCSAGTACASGSMEPSSVLSAMGIGGVRLRSAIRFSFSRASTVEEAVRAAESLATTVRLPSAMLV